VGCSLPRARPEWRKCAGLRWAPRPMIALLEPDTALRADCSVAGGADDPVVDRGLLERCLLEGLSLAEIGRRTGRHECTVAYWLKRHGLQAAHREKHAARGPLSGDRLRELVEAGLSVRAIANVVDRSSGTVRHWPKIHDMGTSARLGRPASAEVQAALAAGLKLALLHCPRPRSHAVSASATEALPMPEVPLGSRDASAATSQAAARCGGRWCMRGVRIRPLRSGAALPHVDPADKAFTLSHRGLTRSLARARREARKCILLAATATTKWRLACGSSRARRPRRLSRLAIVSWVARSGVAQLADALGC
jgi:hypothetical protein